MTDEITLTIPRADPFHPVAHLVLGGLAVRLNLTLEALQELELALDGLLDVDATFDEVTVQVRVDDGLLEAAVGPFARDVIRAELDRSAGDVLGLRRVLETVADEYALDERDGEPWVRLRKSVRGTA